MFFQAPQYGATSVGSNPTATNGNLSPSNTGNSGAANTADTGSEIGTAGAAGATSTNVVNNNNNGGGSSSSSSSSSSSNASAASSSSSLSAGAIAGVSIAAAAVIALILTVGWFCRSGRFHGFHSGATPHAAPMDKYDDPKPMYTSSFVPTSPTVVGQNEDDVRAARDWKSPASQYSELTESTVRMTSPPPVALVDNRSELSP